jgi:hypothetical protein
MLNLDDEPAKVPYIDLEHVTYHRGSAYAMNTYYHKRKVEPDVIVIKRTWQRIDWLMGNMKVENE